MTREAAEDILALPHRYSSADVRRCYTEIARYWHPDAALRDGRDPAQAQVRMVEANKARTVLMRYFRDDPDRLVTRSRGGIESGFAGVDFRATEDYADDPWGFADAWDTADADADDEPSLRRAIFGPWFLRIVFVFLFALVWFREFGLLPHNVVRLTPPGLWAPSDVARIIAHVVYPTYLVLYELLSGNFSFLVREVANDLVTWISGSYMALERRGPTASCALACLLRDQVWPLLLAPIAFAFAAFAFEMWPSVQAFLLAFCALALSFDAFAAMAHGGFVNMWTGEAAEWVERRYLLMHASMLRRCGLWEA